MTCRKGHLIDFTMANVQQLDGWLGEEGLVVSVAVHRSRGVAGWVQGGGVQWGSRRIWVSQQ